MKALEPAPDWTEYIGEAATILFQGQHQDVLDRIESEYLYWDRVKQLARTTELKPEVLWSAVHYRRISGATTLRFCGESFRFNATDIIQEQLHHFDMQIGGQLSSSTTISEHNKSQLLITSLMEEAIASSQIEGAVTTRKKAKKMLRSQQKPKNTSEQMIINNYRTIKRIVEVKHRPMTTELLLELHKLITLNTLSDPDDEGRFRTDNTVNVVDIIDGEVMHQPPAQKQLPKAMDDLIAFVNGDNQGNQFIHPIIRGCIAHYLIGWIHPFSDGNGRTARALFYWVLLNNDYWLAEYLTISRIILKSRNQYYKAFLYAEADGNDITYFIQYKMKAMRLAFQDLQAYIQRKVKERKKLYEFHKLEELNERQAEILQWMSEDLESISTVKEVENRLGVTNQTARTDLEGLVKLNWLEQIQLNGKKKGYVPAERLK